MLFACLMLVCMFLGQNTAGFPGSFYFDLVCLCVAMYVRVTVQAVQALLIPRPDARRLD